MSGVENVNESPEVGVAAYVCGWRVRNIWRGECEEVCGSVGMFLFFHSCNPTLWCLSSLAFQWVMNEGDSWL